MVFDKKSWEFDDVVTEDDANRWEDGIDEAHKTIGEHAGNKENPHGVTKNHVGLGDVDNIKQASKVEFDSHKDDKNNPHSVTKEQVGLSNVDNVKQVKKSGDTMDGDLGVDGNVRTKELVINHPNNEDDPRFKFIYNTNGDLEIWANADGTWEQRAVLGHRYNNGVFTIGGKDVETTEGSLDKANNVMDWIKDYGIGSNARSANFDTVNKTGLYGFTDGKKPFSTDMAFYGFHLERTSEYASQFAITSDGYRAFYRGKTTSGWREWKEIVTKEQLEIIANNLNSHIGSKNNPHNVTKSQIGLENVDNYGTSTQSQAETGSHNHSFMTPLRTKQAIDKLAIEWVESFGIKDGDGLYVSDLNSIDKSGFYTADENTANVPANTFTQVFSSMRNNSAGSQLAICRFSGAESRIFFRSQWSGTWTDWLRITSINDLNSEIKDVNNKIENINNQNLTIVKNKHGGSVPSSFPSGVTISKIDSTDVGYPDKGTLTTYKISQNSAFQIFSTIANFVDISKIYIRASNDENKWGDWLELINYDDLNSRFEGKFEEDFVNIGRSSSAGTDGNIAIGAFAEASFGSSNMAIGYNSEIGRDCSSSIAIGEAASIDDNKDKSIAIGHFATVLNSGEGKLGDTRGTDRWIVGGDFTVEGTKNFEMPHPHPDKKDTHRLRHSAVEAPTAGDNLYRYTVEAKYDGETVELELPDYFQYLNKNVDVWVNGYRHFGRAFGEVEGNILKVTCEKAGKYKCLVIGTRNDDHPSIQTWGIRGVEREIGESWAGETYAFEINEILEIDEMKEEV